MEPNATGSPQTPPPTTPAPAPPPPPAAPSSQTTSAGGVGVTPPGGASSPAVPTPSNPTVPQIPSDVQAQLDRYRAMEREYQQLAQHQHLIPLGVEAYRRAQQAQQQAAPAAAPTPEHPWGIPQFDHRLLEFVGRDERTGQLQLLPGAPPDALLQVQRYQAELKRAQQEFFTDPAKSLQPIIEKMFGGLFEKQFGERYGQIQQQQVSQQIIRQNEDWLYAKDQAGNFVTQFNPATGRHDKSLSPYGQQYVQFLRQAQQYGIADQQAAHEFATTNLQNMLFQQRFAQAQGQQQGQQQQQQVVAQGNATAGQQFVNQNPAVTPPAAGPQSLRDIMRKQFEQNGLTDQVVESQVARVA